MVDTTLADRVVESIHRRRPQSPNHSSGPKSPQKITAKQSSPKAALTAMLRTALQTAKTFISEKRNNHQYQTLKNRHVLCTSSMNLIIEKVFPVLATHIVFLPLPEALQRLSGFGVLRSLRCIVVNPKPTGMPDSSLTRGLL